MNSKLWYCILMSCCLVSFGVGYSVQNGSLNHHTQPELRANVFVLHEGIGGVEEIAGANVITNGGEQYVRNALAFNNATTGSTSGFLNTTTCIGVGNTTTPAATSTYFDTEATTNGFGRSNGTTTAWYNTTGSNFAFNVTKTYTAATAATNINSAGLFWNTGNVTGSLFAIAAITATTFNVGDNCTITWVITVAKG